MTHITFTDLMLEQRHRRAAITTAAWMAGTSLSMAWMAWVCAGATQSAESNLSIGPSHGSD